MRAKNKMLLRFSCRPLIFAYAGERETEVDGKMLVSAVSLSPAEASF